MSDQKTTIGRVVAGVVDVQQTMALQFDSLTKGLEALKLEHQSGISQLREDIRRSDDRSQKQLSDINALHSKELERLHQIIHALLARDASSLGAAAMIPPAQLQQQQQLIMMQRQIDIAHAQAQAHAQNQAMVNLLSAANGAPKQVIPVQQPMSTPAPQLKPQVPTPTAAISILPKNFQATPTAEVTIPTSKPSFPSTTSVAEKQTTSVVIPEKPKNAATPTSSGFSFGGTTPTLPIFGKKTEATAVSPAVVPPGDDDDDKEEDYEPEGEFKPVIPLPDLIEVKTGEEEEQAVFTNRAKLYIFANETSEWKERGTGELKVLYNKEKKSWRVVMRREQVTISEETLPSNSVNGSEELCWNIQVIPCKRTPPQSNDPMTDAIALFIFILQVLKVCANFPIVGSMSIQQMKSNEKAYTWFCEDFSEDEPAHVKLSARFANVDIATEFKTLFEKAVAEHKSTGTIHKEIKPAEKKTEVKKEIKEEIEIPANKSAVNDFGDKFKQEPGSWECSVCYVRCKPDVDECACCGTSKDGSAKEKNIFSKPSLLQPNPGTPKVTFGFGASAPAKEPVAQTSQFGASLNGSPSTNNIIFGGGTPKGTSIFGGGTTNTPTFSFNKPAAATNATTPSFNFNKPTGSTSSPVPVSSAGNSLFGGGLSKTDSPVATPSFSFSKSSETTATKPTFSFGKQATTASSPAVADDKKSSETPKNVFGSFASGGTTFASLATSGTGSIFDTTNAQKAQQELASQKKTSVFGSKTNTPNTTVTSTSRNDDTEDATEEGDGEYEPEVDFKPVIPLPDLIEVKTGEEDEEVMFTARCKLYKYYSDLQENKERGLGDIKLLKSRDGKYRIVMRREQVHKLCANFRIDKSIKLNPKPNLPNVLTFMCQDFSEDPSNADAAIFTAKFKDEATATAFKTAVQEAQSTM
ncbi:CRE-NPP-9 protein [Caenorhabditis remanei]|uniref:CRE-NPP-9 protein n=1 Tax=Caenorhabditis remanei TaxID=31234 RepID=E3LTC4_CAERE|nr:CRE-NPP-9 protein [Caenorhabditis remanei]